MPVGVGRSFDVTVPQPFLHVFERKAHIQQIAGGAVTELVKTDMRHPVSLQQFGELVRHIVRREGSAVLPSEHIIVIEVSVAIESLILPLLVFQILEQLLDLGCHREGASAGLVLRLVLGDELRYLCDRCGL